MQSIKLKKIINNDTILINIIGILVFLTSFIIYILTLCPTVFWYDSTEFIVQGYHLGTAHPTGYPLWGILSKLATFLFPFGDEPHYIAYRINMLAALFSSISVFFTYFITIRFLDIDKRTKLSEILTDWWKDSKFPRIFRITSAVIAALSLSFAGAVWNNSICAEVYTLNLAFVTGLIFILLKWSDFIIVKNDAKDKKITFSKRKIDTLIILLVYLYGISFGNHMSIALLFPGLTFFILSMDYQILKRWKTIILIIITWTFAFISIYFYLPVRSVDSLIKWFDIPNIFSTTKSSNVFVSWDHLWYMLSAKSYSATDFSFSKSLQGIWDHTGRHIGRNVLIFGKIPIYGKFQLNLSVALAFFGAMYTLLANWRRFIMILIIFVSYIFYMASYQPQNQDFLLPVYMIAALMIGCGCYFFMITILHVVKKFKLKKFIFIKYIIAGLFAIIPIYMLMVNYSKHDYSDDYSAWKYGEKMIEYVKDKNLAFFQGDAMAPLLYQSRILKPELEDNFIQMFIYHLNKRGLYEVDKDGRVIYDQVKENVPKKHFFFFEDEKELEEITVKRPRNAKGNQNDTPYNDLIEPELKKPKNKQNEILICYKDPAPLVNKRLGELERFFFNKGYSLKPIIENGKEIYLAKLQPRIVLKSEPLDELYVKTIDISEHCNSDYHHDPFEKGIVGKNHFPALNPDGETLYWKNAVKFKLLPSYVKSKRNSVITTCRNKDFKPIIIELNKKPTKFIYVALCGGAITSKYEEIAKITLNFQDGGKLTKKIWTNKDVFEYWSENHKIFIPPDLKLWSSTKPDYRTSDHLKDDLGERWQKGVNIVNDTKNQNITIIQIPVKSKSPVVNMMLERTNDDNSGLTIFAITQVQKNEVGEFMDKLKNKFIEKTNQKVKDEGVYNIEDRISNLEFAINQYFRTNNIKKIDIKPQEIDTKKLKLPTDISEDEKSKAIDRLKKAYSRLQIIEKKLNLID